MEEGNIENKDNNYNSMVMNNPILLSLDCFNKFIEGFIKGLESSDRVNTNSVMDCIGEILEYTCSIKPQILSLLLHCEEILKENIELKEKLKEYENTESIEYLEEYDGENL